MADNKLLWNAVMVGASLGVAVGLALLFGFPWWLVSVIAALTLVLYRVARSLLARCIGKRS